MKLDRFIRVAIAVVVVLTFIVATGALLFITESALNVWDRLRAGPPSILYGYTAVMVLLSGYIWASAPVSIGAGSYVRSLALFTTSLLLCPLDRKCFSLPTRTLYG